MKSNAYLNGQDILNWYKTPDEMQFTEKGFPILEPSGVVIPRRGIRMLPFNYALNYKGNKKDIFIHFYIQDYLFNRIWNIPQRYIDVLKEYKGIIMPDFSLFVDMPIPLQQFNYYRNLWFARMCQIQGIQVIPSLNWSNEDSFGWCTDGLPDNDVYMLSCVGSWKNPEVRENFLKCIKMSENYLKPNKIIVRSTKKVYNNIKDNFKCDTIFINY